MIAVPPQPAPGSATWKMRPGVDLRPRTRTPLGPHAQELARLMLGKHAGDVIVHHDDLVHMPVPLPGEYADGGRAAADPHALLGNAVDDRRRARAKHEACATVHGHLDGFAIAQLQESVASDIALRLAAAREMRTARAKAIASRIGRGDMADLLFRYPTGAASGPRWRTVSIFALTPNS